MTYNRCRLCPCNNLKSSIKTIVVSISSAAIAKSSDLNHAVKLKANYREMTLNVSDQMLIVSKSNLYSFL